MLFEPSIGASNSSGVSGAGFFILQWVVLIAAPTIHVLVDRKRHPGSSGRVVELYLVWFLAFGGAWAILGGIGHIGPNSTDVAQQIGYEQSFFQWEVGWADIGIGVLGLMCIRRRDGWMTAAAVMLAISYWGDGIGHIMQWVSHDNTAPNNVWAIPSDFLQPLIILILLVLYRRNERAQLAAPEAPTRV